MTVENILNSSSRIGMNSKIHSKLIHNWLIKTTIFFDSIAQFSLFALVYVSFQDSLTLNFRLCLLLSFRPFPFAFSFHFTFDSL